MSEPEIEIPEKKTSLFLPSLEELKTNLKDDDVEVRKLACAMLARLGDPEAVPALIEALQDADVGVRYNAVCALGNFRDPRSLEPLIAMLQEREVNIRQTTVNSLGLLRDSRIIAPLSSMLADEDVWVRRQTITALARMGDKEAISILARVTSDLAPAPEVRYHLIQYLSYLKDEDALGILLALLKDTDKTVRISACDLLGDRHLQEAVVPICALLEDPEIEVQIQATETLAILGNQQAIESLLVMLNKFKRPTSGKSQRRLLAGILNALAESNETDLSSFLPFLEDSDPKIRTEIARIVGRNKASEVIEPLIRLLNDKNIKVIRAAARSLGRPGDKRVIPALQEILHHDNEKIRDDAVNALAAVSVEEVIPLLLEALNDPSIRVHQSVVYELIKLDFPQVLPFLTGILRDDVEEGRLNGFNALEEYKRIEAIPLLLSFFDDPNEKVRRHILSSLLKFHCVELLPLLHEGLKNGESTRRLEIADALQKFIDQEESNKEIPEEIKPDDHFVERLKELVPPLLVALEDPDKSVQRAVCSVLTGFEVKEVIPYLRDLLASEWVEESNPPLDIIFNLFRLGEPGTQDLLLKFLTYWGWMYGDERRVEVARILGKWGNEQVWKPLLHRLKDEDGHVYREVISGLERRGIKNKETIDLLIQSLDSIYYVQMAAAHALSKLGIQEAWSALLPLLKDPDTWTVEEAARALVELDPVRAVAPLLDQLQKNKNPEIMIHVLAQTGAPNLVSLLIPFLTHRYLYARQQAIKDLQKLGDRAAVEPLLKCLSDISPEIRGLAAEALGSFTDPRAIPLLSQLAREDTGIYSIGKRVREAARSALEKF